MDNVPHLVHAHSGKKVWQLIPDKSLGEENDFIQGVCTDFCEIYLKTY